MALEDSRRDTFWISLSRFEYFPLLSKYGETPETAPEHAAAPLSESLKEDTDKKPLLCQVD
jgi:hypothetical protein